MSDTRAVTLTFFTKNRISITRPELRSRPDASWVPPLLALGGCGFRFLNPPKPLPFSYSNAPSIFVNSSSNLLTNRYACYPLGCRIDFHSNNPPKSPAYRHPSHFRNISTIVSSKTRRSIHFHDTYSVPKNASRTPTTTSFTDNENMDGGVYTPISLRTPRTSFDTPNRRR